MLSQLIDVAEIIIVISDINPETKTASESKLTTVRADVNKMMKDYPLFAW